MVTLSCDGELIDQNTGEAVGEIVIRTGETYSFSEKNGFVTIYVDNVWYY